MMPPNPLNPAAGRPHATAALPQDAVRLRGDLRTIARRVTHDLRAPLNNISVATEALQEAAGEGAAAREFVQSVAASVAEASALLSRLSVVLMATANGATPEPVAMGEVVWGALQRLERRIQETGATVVPPPAWPAMTGVAAWLDPIWTNLLANALAHAGPAPRLELGSDRDRDEIRCWVRDSGPGVAPAKRASLFFPLERLSELNAPRTYGLALVQRLVELQGGRCGYTPDPAPGGTFFFTLPAA